jgi:hypothetical protein
MLLILWRGVIKMNNNNLTSSKILPFILLFFCCFFLSSKSEASESRALSLVNNPLISDDVDIVDFPGLVGLYSNSAFLNLYSESPFGNIGALTAAGNGNIILGAWINRSSRWDDFVRTNNAYNDLTLPTTYNLADLYFGTKQGFGVRATISAGLDTTDSEDTFSAGSNLQSTGVSTFGVDFMVGYSMRTDLFRSDLGIGMTFSHFKVAEAGEDVATPIGIPSFLARYRVALGKESLPVNLVMDAHLTRRSYDVKFYGIDTIKSWIGHWNAALTVGPRIRFSPNFSVTTGIKATMDKQGGKNDDIDLNNVLVIGAPGAILSAELLLLDVLSVRAGVDYDIFWEIESAKDEGNIVARERTMGQGFNWATGLGLALGDFQIDATLSSQLLFDGPDWIGGRAPGMLGMISANYYW